LNSLTVSSYYHITLEKAWNADTYDVQIVGSGSRSTISELDASVDIKKTFFTDYNIGVTKYLLLITDSTIIYIVKPIKSYDPTEVDDDTKYYIPASIIDYTNSYQYIEAKKYNFEVKTDVRKLDSVLDEDTFIDSSESSIRKAVLNISDFAADTVSVDYDSTDVLTTQSVLDVMTANRDKLVTYRENADKQYRDNLEAKELNLYTKTQQVITAETEYETAKTSIISQVASVNSMQAANQEENEVLLKVKTIMEQIIVNIKAGTYSATDFPSFDELYAEAKQQIASSS
jgi:hypothetical protein